MKRKTILLVVTIIALATMLMYVSCEVESENENSNLDVRLTPYSPVLLSDFAPSEEYDDVREAIEEYLDDSDEEDKIDLIFSIAEGLGIFGPLEVEPEETTIYSREFEAIMYAHLHNEGMRFTAPDAGTPPSGEDVVLKDLYVNNLQIILSGQTESFTALVGPLCPYLDLDWEDYPIDGRAHIGIAADVEASCDAYMLDPEGPIIASEDPMIQGFISLLADFTIDYEGGGVPRPLETEPLVGSISGGAEMSLGINYLHFNLGLPDDLMRVPMILELKIPEFSNVDLEDFISAMGNYVEAIFDGTPVEIVNTYFHLKELVWGSGTQEITLNIYLGDGDSTPINVESGIAAANLLVWMMSYLGGGL